MLLSIKRRSASWVRVGEGGFNLIGGYARMGCGIDLFSLSLVYVWLLCVLKFVTHTSFYMCTLVHPVGFICSSSSSDRVIGSGSSTQVYRWFSDLSFDQISIEYSDAVSVGVHTYVYFDLETISSKVYS